MSHTKQNGTVVPMIATCKHFAAYDIEGGSTADGTTRFNFDAKVTLQELSEYYLPPFKACVDADVGAIMCSYNSINGVPACANEYLLQKILREHWGWGQDGNWVVSDCQAVQMVYEGHNYTSTKAEAAAKSLNAGTDLECGTYFNARFAYYDYLPAALNNSLVSTATIDKSLIRLYSSLISLGYFDPLPTQNQESQELRRIGWADIVKTDDDLAYKLAVESVVLVKNDGILPLDRSKSIALLGPLANGECLHIKSCDIADRSSYDPDARKLRRTGPSYYQFAFSNSKFEP
jgi:beta-D-xylosidase 4